LPGRLRGRLSCGFGLRCCLGGWGQLHFLFLFFLLVIVLLLLIGVFQLPETDAFKGKRLLAVLQSFDELLEH